MLQNFLDWIDLKFRINNNSKSPLYAERDVYWCSIGQNIGDEEYGKGAMFSRPVLVLKKYNKNLFFGIPLTTKVKDNVYYSRLVFKDKEICAMLSQGRVLDSRRMGAKMGTVSRSDYNKIKTAFLGTFA